MSDEIRSIEIGAVQEVEDLQPELNVLAFMQACIFQDGQVPRCKTWANQRISPKIAVESAVIWRSDKRVGIEPLIRISEHDRACE